MGKSEDHSWFEDYVDFTKRIQKYLSSKDEINLLALEKVKHFPVIGNQVHYLVNYIDVSVFHVSPSISTMLGYDPEEFKYLNDFYDIIHPDDLEPVKQVAVKAISAGSAKHNVINLNQVFHVNYRMRKSNGDYIRVERKTTRISASPEGDLLTVLGILTDISHLKTNGKIELIVTGDPLVDFDPGSPSDSINPFSKREQEILNQLIKNKTSKEIAEELFISNNTVDTHRRNILKKANVKNTSELLLWMIKNNMVQL